MYYYAGQSNYITFKKNHKRGAIQILHNFSNFTYWFWYLEIIWWYQKLLKTASHDFEEVIENKSKKRAAIFMYLDINLWNNLFLMYQGHFEFATNSLWWRI